MLDEEESEYAGALNFLYTSIGYDVIMMSALNDNADDNGIDRILELASGHIFALFGQLGRGKINHHQFVNPRCTPQGGKHKCNAPHGNAHNHILRDAAAAMWRLFNRHIPGIKGFGTIDFDKSQVAHYFPEIFKRRPLPIP